MQDLQAIIQPPAPGIYEVRTGAALPLREPKQVQITGHITAPGQFYNSRKHLDLVEAYFKLAQTHILVCYERMQITLVTDEKSHYAQTVTGQLNVSKEYQEFFVQNPFTAKDLAKHLRKYRYLFLDQQTAMALISELSMFKGKANVEVEDSNDKKGNKRNAIQVAAETTVPLQFDVELPLFAGEASQRLRVEVEVDVRGGSMFEFTIFAPDAYPIMQTTAREILDREATIFKADGLTVLEV